MSSKLRVALLFGGRSGEHEVSVASAASVMQALDARKYDVLPVYLTPQGRWLPAVSPLQLLEGRGDAPSRTAVLLSGDPQCRGLVPLDARREVQAVDVVFPLLHGTYGEDGTVQGLLELADLPYVGAGVLGSAVGMDKGVMKALFQQAGLPVVPHLVIRRHEWERQPRQVEERILDILPLPLFVKPANLGSSVGVTKVKQATELAAALARAAQYDRRLLVEQGLECRELECGVLGNEEPMASVVGEVVPRREFYDYQAKYTPGLSELRIPAPVAPEVAAAVQRLALAAFRAIDAAGLARVDCFLERRSGAIYVNEINTLPGFTTVSMYPKLWEASGIPYAALLDRLIELALEHYRERKRCQTTYRPESSALPELEATEKEGDLPGRRLG
ncbi:MAG: D-alanine--D-alanine ligase [Candidatus Tectimicrobiota bacterium]|nr:MAG: D-alanine--D-alanine ligase [Candidatus Tectomicrobia bacterium]